MMEFEEDHDGEEEEEEEEEDDEEMAITPTFKSSTNDGKKPSPIGTCRYRECLKNHAIGIGGHAVDGCGEFMPAGAEGTLDALKCAACNCHRNFHRKEIVLDSSGTSPHHHSHHHQNHQLAVYTPRPQYHPHPHPHPQQPQVYQFYPYNRTSAGNPTPTTTPAAFLQPRPLALPSPSTGGTQTQTQEQQEDLMVMMGAGTTSSRKKRFRTKFTQEQKEKMLQLAEQLGWRIQKQDEGLVQNFCNETGVRRHVLKVWMHNNKHTLGKKP